MDESEEFEKKSAAIFVPCTPSEKRRWLRLWPRGDFSRAVRALLNALAAGSSATVRSPYPPRRERRA